LVYLLAECDLPFALVERKSFQELIRLLNNSAIPLVNTINKASLSTHTAHMYLQLQEKIKCDFLQKQPFIYFTQDAWTAPSSTAFMGVTAHYINDTFTMHDLTIAVPHVQGTISLYLIFNPTC